jgi:hypothetical protein
MNLFMDQPYGVPVKKLHGQNFTKREILYKLQPQRTTKNTNKQNAFQGSTHPTGRKFTIPFTRPKIQGG